MSGGQGAPDTLLRCDGIPHPRVSLAPHYSCQHFPECLARFAISHSANSSRPHAISACCTTFRPKDKRPSGPQFTRSFPSPFPARWKSPPSCVVDLPAHDTRPHRAPCSTRRLASRYGPGALLPTRRTTSSSDRRPPPASNIRHGGVLLHSSFVPFAVALIPLGNTRAEPRCTAVRRYYSHSQRNYNPL